MVFIFNLRQSRRSKGLILESRCIKMREKNLRQVRVFLSIQPLCPNFDLNEASLTVARSKKIDKRPDVFNRLCCTPPHLKIPGVIILNNKKNTLEKPLFFKREKTVSS